MNRTWPAGLVDTHIHSAPDVPPRLMTDIEVTREANEAGYRAIVLKSHHSVTAVRARLAQTGSSGVRVFGGIALNLDVSGGINPYAVRTALALGAKVVWLPTLTSTNHVNWRRRKTPAGTDTPGVDVLDSAGRPLPALCEVLDLVGAAGATLATGHISAAEIAVVVPEACRRGVQSILVTHPDHPLISLPVESQLELAAIPGVWFERVYLTTLPSSAGLPIGRLAEIVRAVGVDTTVMATDLGQPGNPSPVDGLRQYIDQMRGLGFGTDEIERMTVVNPASALTLDAPARAPMQTTDSATSEGTEAP